MQKAVKRSILNALGFGLIALTLSGCSIFQSKEKPVTVNIKPIEKPILIVPNTDSLYFEELSWTLITPENHEEVFEELEKTGRPVVLFGLTDDGYEALARNINNIRSFIQQQQSIINAYKAYYQSSEKAINDANDEIEKSTKPSK